MQVKIKTGISFQDFLNYANCMAQLLRSNLARIEQHAHTLHGEVLALGALEVPQLAQAEDRYNVVDCSTQLLSIWIFICSSTKRTQQDSRKLIHLFEAKIFLRPLSVIEVCMPRLRLVRLGQAVTNLTTNHSPT